MAEEISRPEQIRQAVAGYVAAAHRAYAAAVAPPGGLLRGDPFAVLAVAAGDLHLIATRQTLPAPTAPEAAIHGEADGLRWQVRFYDAGLVPDLGRVTPGPDSAAEVRRVLGITTWLYHLVGSPARMNEHHARHMGLALAGAGTGASPA
ncbi:MAG TPA: hypothetical protein VG034_04630 [Acidimicrobiia bacterium]|jgi:hypothetical protein|nr:hypothetical protein [Acidimicrobiia bacterium]